MQLHSTREREHGAVRCAVCIVQCKQKCIREGAAPVMYLHMITDSHNSCTLGMTTKDDDDFGDHYKNEEREHVKLVITGLDSIMICICGH